MNKRHLIGFSLLLVIIISFYIAWINSLEPVDLENQNIINFNIPQSQSVRETINKLHEADLIRSKVAFFIYIRSKGIDKNIQAGNFELKKSYSAETIAEELTHGTQDIWVRILEGWRVEETGEYLEKTIGINKNEYMQNASEGFMFPDSYLVPVNTDVHTLIALMKDNYNSHVTSEILQKAQNKGLSETELITLASLVEREANNDNDRKIVAGILLKRLAANWPLQIDATVQYALGFQVDEKNWWKKNLTTEDLKLDSPYNTYLNTGLPKGPIASPSFSSISAVVNSQESSYWYYISDSKTIMHYAETIEEHEENIQKYLD